MNDLIASNLRTDADSIDRRLGPISGRDADRVAVVLRACADKIDELHAELKVARAEAWDSQHSRAAANLLTQCLIYFEDRADVEDGPRDEPVSNFAMSMARDIDALLQKIPESKGGYQKVTA